MVLRDPRRRGGEHRGVGVEQQLDTDLDHALVERERGVIGLDVHRLLSDDVAGVRLGRHVVERDARLPLAVHQHPVHGRPAAVRGKERAVQVERGDARQRQEVGPEEPAVPHRQQDVGCLGAQRLDDHRQLGRRRGEEGQAVNARELGDRLEPVAFVGVTGSSRASSASSARAPKVW